MSATIIHMHETRQAKAQGVFAAVNIAARRLGYSDTLALRAAQRARQRYQAGGVSPARVIADMRAELRGNAEGQLA